MYDTLKAKGYFFKKEIKKITSLSMAMEYLAQSQRLVDVKQQRISLKFTVTT